MKRIAGYEYEILSWYTGKWEVVTTEASHSEAMKRLAEYCENEKQYPHGVRKVKIKA